MSKLNSIFKYFYEPYKNLDYYTQKKAEYATKFVSIVLLAIVLINFLALLVYGIDGIWAISSLVFVGSFLGLLYLLRLKFLDLAVSLTIIGGFIRLLMIIKSPISIQFYVMSLLIILATTVVHTKKYQLYASYIGIFLTYLYKTFALTTHANTLDSRTLIFTESVYTIILYIAFIFMTEFINNIIEREIHEAEKLRRGAYTDQLTGLLNRWSFKQEEEIQINRCDHYAVIMIDIDDFKKINDTYGHGIGDQVIKNVANIIKENSSQSSFCYRWGGEEFLVMLPNKDSSYAKKIAENLRKRIEGADCFNMVNVTISCGVHDSINEIGYENVISKADDAMYRAKAINKNCVVVYEPPLVKRQAI